MTMNTRLLCQNWISQRRKTTNRFRKMTVAIFVDTNLKRSGVDDVIMNLKPGADYERPPANISFS